MPTKTYTPIDEQTMHTAQLENWTNSSCLESGTYSVTSTESLCSKRKVRTAVGVETPGWRKMMNAGVILPMTSWSRYGLDAECSLGIRQWCNSVNRKRKWTNWYHSKYPSILDLDDGYFMGLVGSYDLQYYVQKAASAIYSSGWDAATFIAEIGQLRRMLTGIGKKLDDLAMGHRPGELYDLWLEGRYGWRTLMYDIKDLHAVLKQSNERRTRYREAKGFTSGGSHNEYTDGTSNELTVRYSTSVSWVMNLRGTVVADIDVPDFQFNPVTTAWEVTRLSFVVDWLINVGQALEAASFLLMVKNYVACGGIRVDFNLDGNAVLLSKGTNVSATVNGSWHANAYHVERVPMTVSASPRIKLRLDEYKIIDLLALIAQRLK